MKNPIFLMGLALVMSAVAQANEKVGNGGVGYLCGNQVFMLDYFEAKDRDIEITSLPEQNTLTDTVHYYLTRLGEKDDRGRVYLKLADQMLNDIQNYEKNRGQEYTGQVIHFSKYENSFTDDSKEKFYPTGCQHKVQVIIQDEPKFPEDRLFRFDIQWWDAMNDLQRAIAIVHELFYQEAIQLNQTDSINARYLTEHVTSDLFAEESIQTWLHTLKISKFDGWNFGIYWDWWVNVDSVKFYPDGKFKSIGYSQKIKFFTSKVNPKKELIFGGEWADFDSNGKITNIPVFEQKLQIVDQFNLTLNGELKTRSEILKTDIFYFLSTDFYNLKFDQPGVYRISHVRVLKNCNFHVGLNDQEMDAHTIRYVDLVFDTNAGTFYEQADTTASNH